MIKMQTYTYKDPSTFKQMTFEQIQEDSIEGVYLRGAHDSWVRQKPQFIDDPDGCEIFQGIEELKSHYRPPFVLSLKEATLVGVRTLLDRQQHWFNDQSYIEGELEQDLKRLALHQNPLFNESTGFRPTEKPGHFIFEKGNRREIKLKGKTLVGCCFEAANYGSWIFRVLPKIYDSIKLGLKYDRLLIEYKQHSRLKEFLDLLGIEPTHLLHHESQVIYHLEQAIIPSLSCSHAYLNKETQEFYKMLRSKYGSSSRGDKIYVSRLSFAREGKTQRVMQNETELMDALSREGFKIIFPELLTPKMQIETFSSASLVVGPSGSGMFNVAFCHPGTKLIDIESEPYWIHHHLCLFSSLDLDFGIFVGKVDVSDPNPVHRRWKVNIPALLSRIHSFS